MASNKEVQAVQHIVNYLADYKYDIQTATKVLIVALVHITDNCRSKAATQHVMAELKTALSMLTRKTGN